MKGQKQTARKALAILLTLVMVICMVPMTAMADTADTTTATFTDTEGHWAKDSIERWSVYGVVGGMGDGTFNPNGVMTRAQAASLFAKLLNLKPTTTTTDFSDVDASDWYADSISRVVEAGIMNGVGNGQMNPDGLVTREQFFVMFARAIGVQPQANTSGAQADGSDYSTGYINALTDMGFVKGDGNGVNALADINRASVMALLDQTISTYANKAGETVKAEGGGIALVVAVGVTLSGEAVIVAVAGGAEGGNGVTLQDANVGQLNVMTDADVELTGESNVKDITVAEKADGADLTIGAKTTVGTIENAADNSKVDNKGTVTGTITTTGEKTTVSNSGEVGAIAAKGEGSAVQNTGKVNGNVTSTGNVTNNGTVAGNVSAEGKISGTGTVAGTTTEGGKTVETPAIDTGSSGRHNSNKVAAPTFTPVAGKYTNTQTVTISCGTPDATIYFTTDDTTPVFDDNLKYTGEITVTLDSSNPTKTIKAIAAKDGMNNSDVATAVYKFGYEVQLDITGQGTITPNERVFVAGEEVVLKINSADNWDYTGISMYDASHNAVDFDVDKNADTITFTMPAKNVVLEIEFEQSYAVTHSFVAGNGTISRPNAGYANEVKCVEFQPNYGFMLDTVTIAGISGTVINPTAKTPVGQGYEYEFTMPAEDVIIYASFVQAKAFNRTTGVGYDRPSAALNAATSGQEVVLCVDVSFGGTIPDNITFIVPDGRSLIIENDDTLTVESGATLIIESGATLTIEEGCTLTNAGTLVNNGVVNNEGTITGTGTYTGSIMLDAAYLSGRTCDAHNTAITNAIKTYKPSAPNQAPVENHNDQKVWYAIYSKAAAKYVLIENVVTISGNTYRWVAHTYPNSGSMVYCCANINYFEYYDTDQKARDAGFADLDEANAAKAAMNAAVAGNGFDLKINMYEADTALDATNYENDGNLVSTRTIHCKDNII